MIPSIYVVFTQLLTAPMQLTVELTAKLGESESRMKRLDNLQSVADGLKRGAEAQADTMR